MEINGNLHLWDKKDVIKRLSDYIEYDVITKPTKFAKDVGIDPSGSMKMLKEHQIAP